MTALNLRTEAWDCASTSWFMEEKQPDYWNKCSNKICYLWHIFHVILLVRWWAIGFSCCKCKRGDWGWSPRKISSKNRFLGSVWLQDNKWLGGVGKQGNQGLRKNWPFAWCFCLFLSFHNSGQRPIHQTRAVLQCHQEHTHTHTHTSQIIIK